MFNFFYLGISVCIANKINSINTQNEIKFDETKIKPTENVFYRGTIAASDRKGIACLYAKFI